MIDKDYLMQLIQQGFINVLNDAEKEAEENNAESIYKDFSLVFSKEQAFISDKDVGKNKIYIVVKFLSATMNYAQTIQPIVIEALSESNSIEVCDKLLFEYAEKNHLQMNDEKTVRLLYTKPSIVSNFNEVFDGFRSLFYLTGTLLISENSNMVEIFDRDTQKVVETLQSGCDCQIQLDTQVTYASNNFTKSKSRVGTRILSITAYLTDLEYQEKALKIFTEELPVDTAFNFDVKFKNGLELKNKSWKLNSFGITQNIAEFPVIALLFTN